MTVCAKGRDDAKGVSEIRRRPLTRHGTARQEQQQESKQKKKAKPILYLVFSQKEAVFRGTGPQRPVVCRDNHDFLDATARQHEVNLRCPRLRHPCLCLTD
jgi:hypothetical protein